MTRSAKTAARDSKDQFLLKRLYEFYIIRNRRSGEKIKRTCRCEEIVARIRQTLTQQLSFPGIR